MGLFALSSAWRLPGRIATCQVTCSLASGFFMHSLAVRITKDVCFLRWRRPHCPRCRARCEPLLGRHTHQQMASSQSNPACLSGLNAPRGHAPCPCSWWNPLQQWARRRWPCRSGAAIGLKTIKSIAACAYGISPGCRFGLIFLAASDTVQQPACAARISNAKTQRNASHSARLTEAPPLSKAAQLPAVQPVRATLLQGCGTAPFGFVLPTADGKTG